MAFVLMVPFMSSAQGVNDFVITSFDADYRLTNQDPQGFLEVVETIELDYSGQNRGILRAIPNTYKDNDLNLSVLSVTRDAQPEPYITYEENDNTVIRIGDADTFITGVHSYELVYTLENVISFYDEYDEFFWDSNGDQWLQTFENVSVDLQVDATSKSGTAAQCFAGIFGSTDQNKCQLTQRTNGLEAESTAPLDANETLTVVQAYEKGYFTAPTWIEKYRKYVPALIAIGAQIYAVLWAYKRWRKDGKDFASRATAPFFGRPKNVSVMQASYLKDNNLTPQHISAAIIDLSIRGFIKISEHKEKKRTKHTLELVNLADRSTHADELMLLKGLFSIYNIGTKIELGDKKNKLYTTSQSIATHLDKDLHKKGFYEITPRQAFPRVLGPFLLSIFAGAIGVILGSLTSGLTVVTAGVCFVAVILLGRLMTKRSQPGVELLEHMDGLELYLEKAEKDRIKMQDAVEAPLAPHTGEPTRDVKFFEKLLPFAIAMGVEKSWANAFKDIYAQPPEWYSGNWSSFNTAALASSLSDTAKVTSQSFTAPSSTGGSGSSGGGFSGGGGGGGGGGGW